MKWILIFPRLYGASSAKNVRVRVCFSRLRKHEKLVFQGKKLIEIFPYEKHEFECHSSERQYLKPPNEIVIEIEKIEDSQF